MSHAAAARELLASDPEELVNSVVEKGSEAPVSTKLKALLLIAGKVQQGGRKVEEADIAYAREQGATDMEIHDTVLIAAAFSMFNRYVDGLATFAPQDAQAYAEMGKRMAQGYTVPAQNS
jgi:alkylhydroperoxidase/carboxymuconolactone decarboxylase family protein YurZ